MAASDEDAGAPKRAGATGGRARAVALVAIALSIVVARVVWSSRIEWREAEASAAAGDLGAAVEHYGRAARLYAPGNPYSARAFARLGELATRADGAHDRASALTAWRELRSAILATRGLYTPNGGRLPGANARIAALSAELESPALDPAADEAARTRWHAERLAHDDAPSVPWTLVALGGLAAWIGCAVGLFVRGLDEQQRLRGRVALAWAAGIALGMGLFLVGLARA